MTTRQERNSRILVIDDNESIHQDFRKILCAESESEQALAAAEAALFGDAPPERQLFELDSAFQGQEGLAKAEQALAERRPYAVAFVDMRMPPGWDGVETVERLWHVDPTLQVVICTAYSDYSWHEISERLDLGDRLLILKKPFDNIEAYQMASALTAKWQMAREAAIRMSNLEEAVEERTGDLREAKRALETQLMERQLLENQLLQAHKLESIGQLAAGIAHEINTPVQFVSDSTQFVAEGFQSLLALIEAYRESVATLPPERVALLRTAEEQADLDYVVEHVPGAIQRLSEGLDRISAIVRSMKDFAHPDAHQKSPVDLNRNILSTLTIARSEWKYSADVETVLSELPPVLGHAGELNQALLNIIVNASHAIADRVAGSEQKGLITVRSWREGEEAVVSIRDTGPGIPHDIRHRIFDPFFTTKEVGRGTGQGLAIAYTIIVKKHGGKLTFESESGRGTTFFVRLPLVSAREDRPHEVA